MNRIRELREKMGLTGSELAQRIGISAQHVYDLERGKRRLNETLIKKLCQVFNVSSDYLLGIDYPEEGEDTDSYVSFRGSRFAKLSPESRKAILQLIDRLYEAERGRKAENGAENLGSETGKNEESN